MYAMTVYHPNKRYSVSHVRERLSEALDEADKGMAVFIERRGVRYQLTRASAPDRPRPAKRKPRIEILDPSIEAGTWTWAWTPDGVTFRGQR